MKKWLLSIGLAFGAVVLLLAVSWGWTLTVRPAVEVGPDTTVIEAPLREDGTVDYVAALNARHSEGVTPQNNAFVVIAELTPPVPPEEREGSVQHEQRPAIFEKLGVAMPDDEASYFQSARDYAERRAAEDADSGWADPAAEQEAGDQPAFAPAGYQRMRWQDEWERAQERPWNADHAPLIVQWLDDQTWALDRLAEGVARERYWSPFVVSEPDDLLIGVMLPQLSTMRQMAEGWKVRALHRLEAGDIDAAMADVLALRRLGRHLADRPILIEQLVSIAISGLATSTVTHIAAHQDLTAEQARRLRDELAALGGRVSIARSIDTGERFILLDFLQRPGQATQHPDMPAIIMGGGIDSNRAMRRVNPMYDRMVHAARQPTRTERMEHWHRLDTEVERVVDRWSQPSLAWVSAAVGRRGTLTDAMADLLMGMMIPALDRADTAADGGAMADRLASVALAVAGHRAEHGAYPESLDALVPAWLDEVPVDIFDQQARPVRYILDDDRVAIYSVGRNGEDNGGTEGDRPDEGDQLIEWPR